MRNRCAADVNATWLITRDHILHRPPRPIRDEPNRVNESKSCSGANAKPAVKGSWRSTSCGPHDDLGAIFRHRALHDVRHTILESPGMVLATRALENASRYH